MIRNIAIITWRELVAYLTQPVAYVFIIAFTVLAAGLTFYAGGFLDRGSAELSVFFQFHPWLYLVLMPAIGMRLWAEEYRGGTIELLLTLPLSTSHAVVGKFLAAWIFAALALSLTFPIWLTVSLLGQPDHGVIASGYLGSWLLAGGFLAVSAAASAATQNQVIAFIFGITLCFLLLAGGAEMTQSLLRNWVDPAIAEGLANINAVARFRSFVDGLIDLRAIIFFVTLIASGLFASAALVRVRTGS